MARSPDDFNTSVYRLEADPVKYCDFALVHTSDEVIYDAFDGRSLRASWKPLLITAADEDDPEAELADHALLGTIPVFSLRAVDSLLDLLKPAGELLPLRYPRGEYFAYNVTRVVAALDEEASSIVRLATGRVIAIDKYVFRPEVIEGLAVFKIHQLPRAYVYVTDPFVDRVRTRQLTGFSFRAVWSASGTQGAVR